MKSNHFEIAKKLGVKVITKDYSDKSHKKLIYEFGYSSTKESIDKDASIQEVFHITVAHTILDCFVRSLRFEADEEILTWIQDESFALSERFSEKVRAKGLEPPNFASDSRYHHYKFYEDWKKNLMKEQEEKNAADL